MRLESPTCHIWNVVDLVKDVISLIGKKNLGWTHLGFAWWGQVGLCAVFNILFNTQQAKYYDTPKYRVIGFNLHQTAKPLQGIQNV